MVNKRLSVGIAGYGVVGKRRREYIDKHPYMRTTAVCDQKFKKSSLLPNGVKCFRNYEELLTQHLDAIFVSLPNYMAAEVTIAALKRGLHVFCEKPPAKTVGEIQKVQEVKEACQGLVLKYGFNHRYHDSVKEALRIIQSGDLGNIIHLRGIYGKSNIIIYSTDEWRANRKYSGGGILLDQGIHMVDLMRLFCGDFLEVKSFVTNKHWCYDVEDNAFVIMRDKKGRIAMLHSSATQWQHRFDLHIALTKGYLDLKGILTGTKSYGEETLVIGRRSDSPSGTLKEETTTYLQDNSWNDEIREFADAIINKKPIKSGSIKDAVETMKLVYRIYHADPEWRQIYHIDDPDSKKGNNPRRKI